MEACTCYIAFKELIEPEESRVFKSAKAYIDKNLSGDEQLYAKNKFKFTFTFTTSSYESLKISDSQGE